MSHNVLQSMSGVSALHQIKIKFCIFNERPCVLPAQIAELRPPRLQLQSEAVDTEEQEGLLSLEGQKFVPTEQKLAKMRANGFKFPARVRTLPVGSNMSFDQMQKPDLSFLGSDEEGDEDVQYLRTGGQI